MTVKSLRLTTLVLLSALLGRSTWLPADEPSELDAAIRRLNERVSRMESELSGIRQELAALQVILRENDRPQTRRTSLDIEVLEGGWGDAPTSNIRAVCLSAAEQLWRHFPDCAIEPISVRHSKKGPMVIFGTGSRGERRVLLHVEDTHWAQFAFQFSHEFCHILCNYRETKNPNLWFEESLCETASLFALQHMADAWQTNPPYSNWKSYSAALRSYAAERLASRQDPGGINLADWYRKHESALRANATERANNLIVAAELLPLFTANPQHWSAVNHLNQWEKDQSLSFEDYLLDWHRRTPNEHKQFVADVSRLFGIPIK